MKVFVVKSHGILFDQQSVIAVNMRNSIVSNTGVYFNVHKTCVDVYCYASFNFKRKNNILLTNSIGFGLDDPVFCRLNKWDHEINWLHLRMAVKKPTIFHSF